MPNVPVLRRARPDDAAAVPLLVEAMDVLALELAGVEQLPAAWSLFGELFAARGHRYSHEHVWVLDDAGILAGAILAYPGRDEPVLAAATLALIAAQVPTRALRHQPESDAEEFYLDALAVAATHRRRGLAALMIEGVCAHAQAQGYPRTGLLVDDGKPGVRALYQRLGFIEDGRRTLAGHHYAHMSRR